jgi:hypothetical protein
MHHCTGGERNSAGAYAEELNVISEHFALTFVNKVDFEMILRFLWYHLLCYDTVGVEEYVRSSSPYSIKCEKHLEVLRKEEFLESLCCL